jgi:hypothetical protein
MEAVFRPIGVGRNDQRQNRQRRKCERRTAFPESGLLQILPLVASIIPLKVAVHTRKEYHFAQ